MSLTPPGDLKPCKHGDHYCGHYWTCGPCKKEVHEKAYRRLTPEERAYDRFVEERRSTGPEDDSRDRCCSCHISAPCSYCVNKGSEEEP